MRAGRFLSQLLLLALGLLGSVFSLLLPLELPVRQSWLVFGVLCIAPLFTAIHALPKKTWLAAVLIAGIGFFWALWLLWKRVALAVQVTGWHLWAMYAQGYPGLLSPPPDRFFTVGAYTTESCTVLFLFVLALLAVLLTMAVVRGGGFWLAFFCTFPFWAAPLAVTLSPPLWCSLVLLLFLSVLLLTRETSRSSGLAAGKLRLLLLPITALFLAAVSFGIPREADYARMPWAENLRLKITEKQNQLAPPPDITPPGFFFTEPGERSLRDTLSFSKSAALRVIAPGPSVLYLRGFSSAVYTGDAWTGLSGSALSALEPGLRPPLLFGGAALANTPGNYPVTIRVENIAANPNCLYTPYFLSESIFEDGPSLRFAEDSYLVPMDDNSSPELTVYLPTEQKSPLLPPAELERDRAAYTQFARQEYLSVPPELAAQLETLAEKNGIQPASIAGQTATVAQAADFIRRVATYDVATPPPPVGEDFVSWFLFETKQGYCMHFASAATLLLRTMGVPARYVEGYVARPEDFSTDGVAVVTGRRLHAWVEVYDEVLGWYPLDVTPGQGTSDSPAFLLPQPSVNPDSETSSSQPEPEKPQSSSGESGAPDESQPGSSSGDEQADSGHQRAPLPPWVWKLAVILSIPFLLAGLCLLRRRLVLERREKQFHQKDAVKAALAVYAWLLRLPGGEEAIPEYAAQLVQKARFSEYGLSLQELETLLKCREEAVETLEQKSSPLGRFLYRYLLALI